MKSGRRIISFSVVLILFLCMSVSAFADNKQNLECGIEVEAELIEDNLLVKINNKSSKDIVAVKYAKEIFHNGEKFEGIIGSETIKKRYSDSNIVVGAKMNAVVDQRSLYIPMNYTENGERKECSYSDISVKLYFYYIEFADGSKWGNEYYNLDYIYKNIKPLDLKSSEKTTSAPTDDLPFIIKGTENSHKKLDKNTIKGAAFLGIIIALSVLTKSKKKKSYFKKTKRKSKAYKNPTQSFDNGVSLNFIQSNKDEENAAKGFAGESEIIEQIEDEIPDPKYILRNVYIRREDGKTAEIDIILIHKSGVYVIESKNYAGWIFGNEKQQYWTQTLNKGAEGTEKNKFYNPVSQNKNHVKYLKKYLKGSSDNVSFCSIVVFGDKATLKDITIESDDAYVIYSNQAADTIKAFITIAGARHKFISDEKMKDIYDKLYPLTQVSDEVKKQHIEEIEKSKIQSGSLREQFPIGEMSIKSTKGNEAVTPNGVTEGECGGQT